MIDYPLFFSTGGFAAAMGLDKIHVQHAAANHARKLVGLRCPNAYHLPDGWVSFRWENIWIVCPADDESRCKRFFGLE